MEKECCVQDVSEFIAVRPRSWDVQFNEMNYQLFKYMNVVDLDPAEYVIREHYYILYSSVIHRVLVTNVGDEYCHVHSIDVHGGITKVKRSELYKMPSVFLNYPPFVILLRSNEKIQKPGAIINVKFENFKYEEDDLLRVYDFRFY